VHLLPPPFHIGLRDFEGVRIFGSGEEIWIIVGAGLAVVAVVVVVAVERQR